MTFTRRLALPLLSAPFLAPGLAGAQPAWPERQIRWVIGFPPAGTADILSRILAERIAQQIGQPVVVENRSGAGATIAANLVAQARGDRHIVLLNNVSHAMSPALFPNVTFVPYADFAHVAILGALPMVIAVNPAFPAQDILDDFNGRPQANAARRLRQRGEQLKQDIEVRGQKRIEVYKALT